MYIFEIGFEVTFSVAPKPSSQAIYGHSNSSDLQVNMLGKNFGVDLFTQHYGGFYLTDSNKPVPSGTAYPDRPDISVWNTGVNGIYIFNKNKYSLRAAYNFSERQLHSGGSFILSGTINTFSLRADSAVYGNKYASTFGTTRRFCKIGLHYPERSARLCPYVCDQEFFYQWVRIDRPGQPLVAL